GSFAAFWLHNNKGRLTRGCNPAYSKSIHTWLRFGEIMRGSLRAKQELGALIAACRREHVFCACVMHGHGKHILKQQTPLWLAQHPHVMAFHQAPKEYGGDAALLVLIEVEEWLPPELP
ncbi:endonuclease SmrB, partial [Escherichia coli]|uniref:endonuclease SmrB n=1 Tax=Escherichia coli TaxID=562 RepID=UPI003CC7CC8F